MKKLLFALGLLLPVLLSAQQVPRSLTAANGTFIGFYEYKPPLYTQNPTRKFPLIIFLHGVGEQGDGSSTLSGVLNIGIPHYINLGLTDMQFNYNGTTEGFLVLSPQLRYGTGYWPPFYVEEMIRYAKQNLRVDTNRIYLTGISLGGGGVWGYASSSAAAAKGLAAIAPICGTCEWSNACNIAQNALPVWAFHALDDVTVFPSCTQGAIGAINACNPIVAPIATYYPTGQHWIWDQALDYNNPQLYLWFLSKSRGSSTPPPAGGNVAPVANAGTAQTITLPTNSASLSGSGSYDSDGTITSYQWSQISGPNTASFTNAWASNTNIGGLVQGTYSFKLTVTDNAGATGTANVSVTVNAAATPTNTPPVAVVSTDQTIMLPANSVFLLGSGSYDIGGWITAYAWSQASGPNTATITPMGANLDVKNMVAGTYTFKLTVTDNSGLTGSANVTVTVNGGSAPPPTGGQGAPIAITSGNQTVTLPNNSIFLLGSGSYDIGGWITAYSWSQASGPNAATITPVGANLDVKNMVAGTYTFKLTVTDNSGLTGSANVTVTVNGAATPPTDGNTPPVALAGSNQYITLPTSSVYLMGGGSYDIGGYITNYAWSQVSGPNTATLNTISTTNVEAKNLIAGTYTFRLTVTDNGGATNSANMQVIVNGTGATAMKTASVAETIVTNGIVLYPNPVNTTLNVQVSNNFTGDLTINIINASGTTVKAVRATKTSYQFIQQMSVQDLPAGTYVAEVRFNDGSRQTSGFVKQ